jgi:2-polyprenyl-3-methyl-5-hydroxy-6-metoxy-1,4-benzoquinol methylase
MRCLTEGGALLMVPEQSGMDKGHWYDGWFHDRCISPNQDGPFRQIKGLITPNSRVLDAGCGTGRLAFSLADNAKPS